MVLGRSGPKSCEGSAHRDNSWIVASGGGHHRLGVSGGYRGEDVTTLGILTPTDSAQVLAKAAAMLGIPPVLAELLSRKAPLQEAVADPTHAAMSDNLQGIGRLVDRLASHESKLDRIITLLERLLIMSSTLTTDVAALTTAVGGLTTAINNEGSIITQAVTDIKNLIAGGTVDPAALTAITDATNAITAATTNITNAGSTLASALPPPAAPAAG